MRNNLTGKHKIGKSIDPTFREKTLQSQEPDVTLLFYCSEEIITETRDAVDISLYQSPEADIARNILQHNNVSIFGQGIYNADGKKIDEEVLMRGMDAE